MVLPPHSLSIFYTIRILYKIEFPNRTNNKAGKKHGGAASHWKGGAGHGRGLGAGALVQVDGAGWEYVHVAIDDHSRIAFSAIHANEKGASAREKLGAKPLLRHLAGLLELVRLVVARVD